MSCPSDFFWGGSVLPGGVVQLGGEVRRHGEGARAATDAASGHTVGHVQPHRPPLWSLQCLCPGCEQHPAPRFCLPPPSTLSPALPYAGPFSPISHTVLSHVVPFLPCLALFLHAWPHASTHTQPPCLNPHTRPFRPCPALHLSSANAATGSLGGSPQCLPQPYGRHGRCANAAYGRHQCQRPHSHTYHPILR